MRQSILLSYFALTSIPRGNIAAWEMRCFAATVLGIMLIFVSVSCVLSLCKGFLAHQANPIAKTKLHTAWRPVKVGMLPKVLITDFVWVALTSSGRISLKSNIWQLKCYKKQIACSLDGLCCIPWTQTCFGAATCNNS